MARNELKRWELGAQDKVLPGTTFSCHIVVAGGGRGDRRRILSYSSSGIQNGLLCTNIFTWCEINSHSCYEAGVSGSEHGTRINENALSSVCARKEKEKTGKCTQEDYQKQE